MWKLAAFLTIGLVTSAFADDRLAEIYRNQAHTLLDNMAKSDNTALMLNDKLTKQQLDWQEYFAKYIGAMTNANPKAK